MVFIKGDNLMFCFLSIFIIITIVNGQIDPRGTPLDELIHFQHSICKDVIRASEIKNFKVLWSRCIDSFILRPDPDQEETDDELNQYYNVFCRYPIHFKQCWNNITIQLNKCDPGRGDVSAKIYFAIYDYTCRNSGNDTIVNLLKSSQQDELCELDYTTKICNETKSDWYSKDICRRFESQKLCEDSAIDKCNNEVHKKILRVNLQETGRTLGCIKTIKNSSSALSTSGSNNSQISVKLNRVLLVFFILLYVTS